MSLKTASDGLDGSGSISIHTGASTGSSGDILIETGDAESGDAGRLTLSVGSSTGIGGDISVTAGASADSARGGASA